MYVDKTTSLRDCKNNLKYSLTPWCKHQWKRHTSPYLSHLWRTYLEILSMFAICFWLRMTSMAAHTNWTTLGSACLFFTTRDMISLFITTVGNGGIILKSADFIFALHDIIKTADCDYFGPILRCEWRFVEKNHFHWKMFSPGEHFLASQQHHGVSLLTLLFGYGHIARAC